MTSYMIESGRFTQTNDKTKLSWSCYKDIKLSTTIMKRFTLELRSKFLDFLWQVDNMIVLGNLIVSLFLIHIWSYKCSMELKLVYMKANQEIHLSWIHLKLVWILKRWKCSTRRNLYNMTLSTPTNVGHLLKCCFDLASTYFDSAEHYTPSLRHWENN